MEGMEKISSCRGMETCLFIIMGNSKVLRGAEAEKPWSTHPYIPTSEGWLYLAVIIDCYEQKDEKTISV